MMEWGTTVWVEIAHMNERGDLHGHSLAIEVYRDTPMDLDKWRSKVNQARAYVHDQQLERAIGGGTFEAVATFFLEKLPDASRVVVRLPSAGHLIEARRQSADVA